MLTLGIKYTHDAGIALLENDKLLFSIEMEKINNRSRYTRMDELRWIDEALDKEGVKIQDIDKICIDGWKRSMARHLHAAAYTGDHLATVRFTGQISEQFHGEYVSTSHVYNHAIGSYAMHPDSHTGEEIPVIVWDGSALATLCYVSRVGVSMSPVPVLPHSAGIYDKMGVYWGPYKGIDRPFGRYELPGKLMAWMAGGEFSEEIYHFLVGTELRDDPLLLEVLRRFPEVDDKTVLLTLHIFLGRTLVNNLLNRVNRGSKIIFTGGAALNIKWNSWLRAHYDVWVPPCPNDSGSAIGAAVAGAGVYHTDWDVFSGPRFEEDFSPGNGWIRKLSDPWSVAIHCVQRPDEPVLILRGRAEIGPRALGNRSIIMAATRAENKDIINRVKGREDFRPVAPICLEEKAHEVFRPGGHDPYMLFDHAVRDNWKYKVPAIIHTDGTARLQTVRDGFMADALRVYQDSTGIPLLCNSSANLPSCGFFDKLPHALAWAEKKGINRVFCDEGDYRREQV